MKEAYRYCLGGCGKRIDNATGKCPTPEACAKFRSPHRKSAEEARRVAARAAERKLAEPVQPRQPAARLAGRARQEDQ